MDVEEVTVEETFPLRRQLLRQGPAARAPVELPGDHDPAALHLAIRRGGDVVAVASFLPSAEGMQLRGMAVAPELQSQGLGRRLMESAVERLRRRGEGRLWCNARDPAIPFYERLGMLVTGEGFVEDRTGLPHHCMHMDL